MFLPHIPELEKILKNIRGEELPFKETLTKLLFCLENESVDVRLQTLKTLSSVLDTNIGSLQGLVVCSDRTDPIITSLTSNLMSCLSSREPEKTIRQLAAVCLGEIGSVDPGKLEFAVNLAGSFEDVANRNKLMDVFSVGFCVELLQELVRARASSTENMIADNCAYSIQEVLKVYNIDLNNKSGDAFTWRVWRQISDSYQEKLTPLLTSMYVHEPGDKIAIQSPLFKTDQGKTYKDWIVNWSQFLIENVKDSKARSLFDACLPAIKKDLRIAEFLLPRIVIEVLSANGDPGIMKEFACVIDVQNNLDDNSLLSSVAQALFTVLDQIGLWLRAKFNFLMTTIRKSESQMRPEEIQAALKKSPEYLRIKSFIDKMPHAGLANLSFAVSFLFQILV